MWADVNKMSEMESGLNVIFVSNTTNREEYNIHFDENPQIQLDIHPSLDLLYCIASKENTDERVLVRKDLKNGWSVGKVHRISISRNKTHIKLYVNEKKFIDLPNGLPKKGVYTLILSTNMWGDGLFFTNFKLAEGLEFPTKLDKEGKFVTNAIYFNINSSQIKPESWAALSQAATVIKSAQGKITITGHTDSDGSDDANLILSKKRAEAVRLALIKKF
ncbi:MAG: OmpA/MotB domain-containing protein [Bacteroidetes bacterium OLB11]|nr:MAG: OmpA/MotB domain-containing protein [Bacteroidetes bacterium OLB11]